MDKHIKGENYPLLGEPKRMFEDDDIYVISELAEKNKIYSFVCPHCHTIFLDRIQNEEVKMAKCPDCDTYISFSSHGKKDSSSFMHTRAITSKQDLTQEGMLFWKEGNVVKKKKLNVGQTIIGRQDDYEPSDISLNDDTASRRSVKIVVTKGKQSGNYTFKLEVLRTTNAVYVNKNALYTQNSIYLNNGDKIKIGETILTLISKQE